MWLADALRAGERHSVPDLARRFGVSPRTIARDLALLRDQELPIEGLPGPGGGVRLRRRAEATPRLALTDDEVAALWLSVWVGAVHGRPDAAGPAASAIRKVEAALPHDQRHRLRALASRILVGAAAGRHLLADASLPCPAVIAALASALEATSVIRIEYVDAAGARTSRLVEPHALLVQVPLWYLLALDRDRGAPRTFRLDRVLAATPSEATPSSRSTSSRSSPTSSTPASIPRLSRRQPSEPARHRRPLQVQRHRPRRPIHDDPAPVRDLRGRPQLRHPSAVRDRPVAPSLTCRPDALGARV